MRILISLSLLLLSKAIIAQGIAQEMSTYFQSVEKGKKEWPTKAKWQFYYNNKNMMTILHPYAKSTNLVIRKEAIRVIGQVGNRHTISAVRLQAVHLLLDAAEDEESSIVGQVPKKLRRFKVRDFDASAKDKLVKIIQAQKPYLKDFLMVAGMLELKKELLGMREALKGNKSATESLSLALVRSGDKQKLKTMMKNIQKLPIDDNFVYRATPLLVYVRQKETMDYLFDAILSHEKGCTSADERTKIYCGYRLMEMVAPVVIDFPVKVGPSGDIDTDDYEKALEEVRAWIKVRKGDYKLNRETY